jgi:osmotically inducible protein OsmC
MPLAVRSATTKWTGDLVSGSGELDFETGAARSLPVSWAARTEEPGGKTSPEELLAAAQASCYAMALASTLARDGHPPEALDVTASATLDRVDGKPKVTEVIIQVRGRVPGIDASTFQETATRAEQGCPIANALRGNVQVKVEAELGQ